MHTWFGGILGDTGGYWGILGDTGGYIAVSRLSMANHPSLGWGLQMENSNVPNARRRTGHLLAVIFRGFLGFFLWRRGMK